MPVSSLFSRLRSLRCALAAAAVTRKNRTRTRNLTCHLAFLGLFGLGATSAPIINDRSQEAYQTCSADLLASNLDPEAAALACATAYKPLDLAACVTEIDAGTEIAPDEALSACREVRRPRDLSNCTVRIDDAFSPTDPLAVMDSCRRSLLPVEFANCTIGETNEIEMTVDVAMATCLDANDRVRDVFPTFIPTR